MFAKPQSGTYNPYLLNYIDLVPGNNPLQVLKEQVLDFKAMLSEISFENEDYRYAEGKWSVKELVGHIIDSERIFAYRALAIARGEEQSIPGYDENLYAAEGRFDKRTLHDLAHEYGTVREATITLFRYMDKDVLTRQGTANEKPLTPLTCLWVIAGHQIHHENVLRERYGNVLFS
ncbi:MAG: DinB family protein [Bacteroidia bacterium]